MRTARIALLLALAGSAGVVTGAALAGPQVSDGFEAAELDAAAWVPKDVRYGPGADDPQLEITTDDRRCGARAAQVRLQAGDAGRACKACERAEVWQAPGVRPRWGEETWVGFSMKLAGGAPAGSKRTVVGQWKTPSDRSPFLAVRYDNRVFHLTVDAVNRSATGVDTPVRRTIACSVGDPERLISVQAFLGGLDAEDPDAIADVEALRDRAIAQLGRGAYAPAAETEEGDAARPSGGDQTEFACIQDPKFHMHPSRVAVQLGERPVLPDPAADWVDLQFGILTGHRESTVGPTDGRIEVWVDGHHAVTMTGDLDAPLHPGEARSLYYKFGIYRDADAREDVLLLDEFRQGRARADVVPLCPRR